MEDKIIALSLKPLNTIIPLTTRKCYKCQRVLPIKEYGISPSPDLTNGGRTWACRSCLGEDGLNYGGGFRSIKNEHLG